MLPHLCLLSSAGKARKTGRVQAENRRKPMKSCGERRAERRTNGYCLAALLQGTQLPYPVVAVEEYPAGTWDSPLTIFRTFVERKDLDAELHPILPWTALRTGIILVALRLCLTGVIAGKRCVLRGFCTKYLSMQRRVMHARLLSLAAGSGGQRRRIWAVLARAAYIVTCGS